MDAAEIYVEMSPRGDKNGDAILPNSEKQLRSLKRLPDASFRASVFTRRRRCIQAAIRLPFFSGSLLVAVLALPFDHCRSRVICSSISLDKGTKSTSTVPRVRSVGSVKSIGPVLIELDSAPMSTFPRSHEAQT